MAGQPLPKPPDDGLPPIAMYHPRKRPSPITLKTRFEDFRRNKVVYLQRRRATPGEVVSEAVVAAAVALALAAAIAWAAMVATGSTAVSLRAVFGLAPFVGAAWGIGIIGAMWIGGIGELITARPWIGAAAIAVVCAALPLAGLDPAVVARLLPFWAAPSTEVVASNLPPHWSLVGLGLGAGYAAARTRHRWLFGVAALFGAAVAFELAAARRDLLSRPIDLFMATRSALPGGLDFDRAVAFRSVSDMVLTLVPPLTLYRSRPASPDEADPDP
jgi:hypothetical protein